MTRQEAEDLLDDIKRVVWEADVHSVKLDPGDIQERLIDAFMAIPSHRSIAALMERLAQMNDRIEALEQAIRLLKPWWVE